MVSFLKGIRNAFQSLLHLISPPKYKEPFPRRGPFVYRPKRRKPFLPKGMVIKAQAVFDKGIGIFYRRTGRMPNRTELIRIAINSSHILVRRKGKIGHWRRQKVRKVLLERQEIPFKMN
jgi:hypothetical protein